MSNTTSCITQTKNFLFGDPNIEFQNLPVDSDGEYQTERSQCGVRLGTRAGLTALNAGAVTGAVAIMNVVAPAIAHSTAATTGAAAASTLTLLSGAIFGAISAPIALLTHKVVQYILFAAVDKYATNKDTWGKVANFAAAAIAAVAAIIATAFIMGALGTSMTLGTAFILGAPMLAFVAIKYLFMPCWDACSKKLGANTAAQLNQTQITTTTTQL